MTLLWILNLSDGSHSLLDIAERSGMRFEAVVAAANALRVAGLLADDHSQELRADASATQ
jgi:aminopeptidase-like protein